MINVFEPTVQDETMDLLSSVFKRKWLGKGELSERFSAKFRNYLRTERIGLCSCASDAIYGILTLLEFKENEFLAIPINSFPMILNSVILNKINYILCDIDPDTGNISLEDLFAKSRIHNLKGVFLTHYGGVPVDVAAVRNFFGEDFYILEDSACALGTEMDGYGMVGSKADFSCWSFDAMKLVSCGEGGAFYCNCPSLHNRLEEFLYLGLPVKSKSGMDNSAFIEKWWEYSIENPGIRSVFTDVSAAIGLPNLSLINEKLDRLKQIRSCYENEMKINFVGQNLNNKYSNYFFTVFSERRDYLATELKNSGVYCTLRYHRLDLLKLSNLKYSVGDFPGADIFYRTALNIPIHVGLSNDDVQKIINLVNEKSILDI